MWTIPYKSRTASKELQILKYLNTRTNLSAKDKRHYLNLKKGFEGEKVFDSLTETLQCESLLLNDLLLKVNNALFQIDSIIICSDTIYLIEVKNYDGDYLYELDKFYTKGKKTEIINPLHQLGRCESLLHQFLDKLGYKIPLNKPIIFPTQLNQTPSKINANQRLLADKLVSLHIVNSPYNQLPPFDYRKLRKGICCVNCNSFSISIEGKHCICKDCGEVEMITATVLRSVTELKLLFPNEKITTNLVHDWCKVITSKKRIKRILGINFKVTNVKRWSSYE